jgi:hypothetical protein
MGLLDDAIREHLDLKRLRGADPGEVAREQREALDPVPRDGRHGEEHQGEETQAEASAVAVSGHDAGDVGDGIEVLDGLGEENGPEAPEPERDADFSHVGQETAEFDMRAVLGEDPSIAQANPAEASTIQARSVEEPEELGGTVEDVLEETPDFLRDTPEQDRLWFEQQPPRDFDFDK